jgi:hypothetical protein
LAQAFDALEVGALEEELLRRLDTAATPASPRIGFRRRIGVWRELGVVDLALVDRCIDRWEYGEAKGLKIEAFLKAVGFGTPAGTIKTPREGTPPELELELTEG